jgi:hypothetical protein
VEQINKWYSKKSRVLVQGTGEPSIIYQSEVQLVYVNKTDLGWGGIALDRSEFVGQSTSIDMVFLDQPHVSYHNRVGYSIKYAERNTGGWSVIRIDSAGRDSSNRTALSLSPNGYPHILYAKYGVFGDGLQHKYSEAENWNHEIVWDGSWHSWTYPGAIAFDLVVDFQGQVRAVDRAWLYGMEWVYLSRNGYWNEPIFFADSEPYPGEASITISSAGEIHVAHSGDNLLHSVQESSGWFTDIVDTGGVHFPSIDLDTNGLPRISYYDTTTRDLKYAKFNGTAWEIEIVDTVGDVGSSSSLAVDHRDMAHIAYYDATNGDLKYAYFNGSDWEIYTLVSEGDVGSHCSLALDPFGNPYIPFHDAGLGDLKIIYIPPLPSLYLLFETIHIQTCVGQDLV